MTVTSGVGRVATALLLASVASCSLLNRPRFSCDPVGPSAVCTNGDICVVSGSPQSTDCTQGGIGEDGDPCGGSLAAGSTESCTAGFACVSGRCRAVCHVGADADCASVAVTDPPYLCFPPSHDGDPYGFCCPSGGCR